MEPYGAYESIFFITVSGIELAIVLNVVEHQLQSNNYDII